MTVRWHGLASPLLAAFFVSLLTFLSTVGLREAGYLRDIELAAFDSFVRIRATPSSPSSRVVLVTILESDIQSQGVWPLPDATIAVLIEAVEQQRPRAIGLDIYRDIPVAPGHQQLEAALLENPEVIVVNRFRSEAEVGVSAPAVLMGTDRVGFNDLLPDPGGIVRRGLLFLDDGRSVGYAFALRLALRYLAAEGIEPRPDPVNPAHIRLGSTTIPRFRSNDGAYVGADDGGYQFLLDFRAGPGAFPAYSLADVLSGRIPPAAFTGKVVLIGSTAESVPDVFYTPLSRKLVANQQIFGVTLHAHILSQLLRIALDGEKPISSPGDGVEMLWIGLWVGLGGLTGLWARTPWRFIAIALLGTAVIVGIAYAFFVDGVWIPSVPPAFSWLAAATVVTTYMVNREARQRKLLMNLFSRHVSADLADEIWRQRDDFLRGGRPKSRRLVATVMFTDLHEFTKISEKLGPQALMDWLNDYMEAMTPLVISDGGVILRFIGDAIMAVFGVPIARTTEAEIRRDAQLAVHCALAMQERVVRLNAEHEAVGLPPIGMRVGINTGEMVGGSLGSVDRLEYNVHGDTVNVAARLESFEKESFMPDFSNRPSRILVGEATHRYLDGEFVARAVGSIQLKGKEERVTAYEILGYRRCEVD